MSPTPSLTTPTASIAATLVPVAPPENVPSAAIDETRRALATAKAGTETATVGNGPTTSATTPEPSANQSALATTQATAKTEASPTANGPNIEAAPNPAVDKAELQAVHADLKKSMAGIIGHMSQLKEKCRREIESKDPEIQRKAKETLAEIFTLTEMHSKNAFPPGLENSKKWIKTATRLQELGEALPKEEKESTKSSAVLNSSGRTRARSENERDEGENRGSRRRPSKRADSEQQKPPPQEKPRVETPDPKPNKVAAGPVTAARIPTTEEAAQARAMLRQVGSAAVRVMTSPPHVTVTRALTWGYNTFLKPPTQLVVEKTEPPAPRPPAQDGKVKLAKR